MLLHELKDPIPTKDRNFVAKHAQRSGAGQHVAKKGEKAPRNRQKRAWKKETRDYL